MEAERDHLGGEDGLWNGCCLPWAGRPQAPVGQLREDSLGLPRADCREGPRQGLIAPTGATAEGVKREPGTERSVVGKLGL